MSGNGRIITRENGAPRDVHGRLLSRAATVEEVYKIVADETAKVHEFYLGQLPPFVANMIVDGLVGYGVLTKDPRAEVVVPEVPPIPVEGCVSPVSETFPVGNDV